MNITDFISAITAEPPSDSGGGNEFSLLLYILKLEFRARARSERNHQNKKIQMCLLLIADYADYQWQYPCADSGEASVYTVSGSAFEP